MKFNNEINSISKFLEKAILILFFKRGSYCNRKILSDCKKNDWRYGFLIHEKDSEKVEKILTKANFYQDKMKYF